MGILIMGPKMKALFDKAMKDEEFFQTVKKLVPNFRKPNIYSTKMEENAYAIMYAGYYIGKYNKDPE